MAQQAEGLRGGLPMYALPELEATTAAWWRGLARHLKAAGAPALPEQPEHPARLESLWLSPRLVLAQTCGYPLTHGLAGKVRYVATFCYGAPGCYGASYCSLLLVRREDPALDLADLRGRRAVINSWDSHSGMNALCQKVAPLAREKKFFQSIIVSGSHRESLATIRNCRADLAAVDCVTFALLQQEVPEETRGLRVLGRTVSAPGLPLITRREATDQEVAALRGGLAAAVADTTLEPLRSRLLVRAVEVLPEGAYGQILEAEAAASEG